MGRSDLPTSICALPWVNLSLDVDGTSRPCCKFAHQEPDSRYQLANLADTSLGEVWNSVGMQRLRRDFRAGVKPAECSTCWDEEAAGVQSYRQTFVDYRHLDADIDFDDTMPASPQALDLKLTNACNLKCRICGPVASSLWLQEELATREHAPGSFVAQLADQRTYYLSNKVTHDADNLATVTSWLAELRYVELTGGEPMLSPENRELVELIATTGRPDQVGILFNTNATVIDDRILRHLDEFREVKVCLSIDDLDTRFEYQRAPAKWDVVQANLERYQAAAHERFQLYAFCSVGVLNVWYLPEYVRWLLDRDDPSPMGLVLNLVHYPRHFSVQVLPPAVKVAVRDRLERTVVNDPSMPDEIRDAVVRVLDFMDHSRTDDGSEWRQCVATIKERDGIRGEHYERVFPEFASLLRRAGSWDDGSPVDIGR